MLESIVELLFDEALVVIPALWILGSVIKNTPRTKEWMIPFILLPIGIMLTLGLMGVSVDSVIQGILVTGAAVYGHQLYKQGSERDEW